MKRPPKARAPEPLVSDNELEGLVRDALAAKPGLKRTQLKKALPKSYQRLHERALRSLRELVGRGEAHRWAKASTELFYSRDPVAMLDKVVNEVLATGPMDPTDLKEAVDETAPGHGQLLAEWLKNALGRGFIFEHSPAPPSRKKRYGLEPDVRFLLTKELAALRKALPSLDARGIRREQVASVLLAELGVPNASPPRASNGGGVGRDRRQELLAALDGLAAVSPEGALLLVRELRARTAMNKEDFDATALWLLRDGIVTLHHHDHAGSLSERERSELVQDGRGGHYSGVARRRGS